MVSSIKKWLKKLFTCHLLGFHDWTCAAIEGIAPTKEQLESGVEGFFDYAKTYCKLCEKESELSKEARHGCS